MGIGLVSIVVGRDIRLCNSVGWSQLYPKDIDIVLYIMYVLDNSISLPLLVNIISPHLWAECYSMCNVLPQKLMLKLIISKFKQTTALSQRKSGSLQDR